eukprot:EC792997.1.p1 GENE.EC792997.1~~EC792997.1.p1  ORF type:complete len:61 (-),score=1.23 EC792997.1:88-270(-)
MTPADSDHGERERERAALDRIQRTHTVVALSSRQSWSYRLFRHTIHSSWQSHVPRRVCAP